MTAKPIEIRPWDAADHLQDELDIAAYRIGSQFCVFKVACMSWWLWIVLGLALLAVEVTVDAAFWLLLIGLSAVLVGVGGMLGLTGGPVAQWLAFAGLSLVLLYFFRGRLRAFVVRRKEAPVEAVVGEAAIAVSAIAAGAPGKAMLRGAKWEARNIGSTEIPQGARARVARVNQLVLELTQD